MTDEEDDDTPIASVLDIEWKCCRCKHRLGLIKREDKCQLRIKNKDFYLQLAGAKKLTVNCTKCGEPNVLEEEDYSSRFDVKITGTVTITDKKGEYQDIEFSDVNAESLINDIKQL